MEIGDSGLSYYVDCYFGQIGEFLFSLKLGGKGSGEGLGRKLYFEKDGKKVSVQLDLHSEVYRGQGQLRVWDSVTDQNTVFPMSTRPSVIANFVATRFGVGSL